MILVTGATGTLGAHLLLHLLKKEEKIVALKRKNSNIDNVRKIFSFYVEDKNEIEKLLNKIIWREADITDFVALDRAFEGINKVYHCAALIDLSNKNLKDSMRTNAEGTANIVNLALSHNVEKICHVSSIAALGSNSKGPTTEDFLLNPEETKSYYSLSKYFGELEVWRGIEEGLNAVIVNPSIIVAPYLLNSTLRKILRFFFKHGIKYYVCGKKGYIDVNDLVRIMIILTESNISAENFIVSAQNLSFRQILDYVNRYFQKKFTKKKIPITTFKLLKIFSLIFGKNRINNQLISYLYNDEIYSSQKLETFIDYKFTPIQKSIYEILDIYRKHYKIID